MSSVVEGEFAAYHDDNKKVLFQLFRYFRIHGIINFIFHPSIHSQHNFHSRSMFAFYFLSQNKNIK
jgi:hypothetical protein